MDLSKPLLQPWRKRTGKEEVVDEEKGADSGGPVTKLQKSYFDVLGVCCSSEISLIENILKPVDGIKDVSVIVVTRTVIVYHDSLLIPQTQIANILNKARLEASVKLVGEVRHHRWPSPYAIASGALLLLSLFKYIYDPMKWVALAAVAAGILPILLKGATAVRGLRIDINILVLSAVIGTIVLKDYVEAGTIVFLFSISQWLESRASHKASVVMSSMMSMAPQKATIAETGEVVDVNEVQLNTVLAVKAGEVIPIDGVVINGICEVDEKTLTGESYPVSKQIASQVWAGTINLNGYISVRTTALAEDCVVAQMGKLVEEAQNKKSATQRFVDEFTKFYTPAVLIISIVVAVVPAAMRVPDQGRWLRLALVVLVSACPCALILSTPVATFCALTKAAENGLLIKGGDYLEILGKVKTVAFDKTGTITKGEFSVSEFQPLQAEVTLETLLYWVSSIESKSSHPLAAPLVQYARSYGVEPRPGNVEDFLNFPGKGIYGKIDGKEVFIGNKRLAIKAGSAIVPSLQAAETGGRTVGYVYAGATLVGIFCLLDECRTGVAEAIEQLKSLNIKTAMLTGDNQEAAVHAQNQVRNALDHVYAELLPEEKLKIIEELKKDGPTAMVGDGINDAPSLAASDIGISMGIAGSALAIETGNVILMSNDIGKIPSAVILGRRSQRKVIENVIFSVLTKGAILALAIAGHPLIWAAVLADTGTCLVVILNSMLLLREKGGPEQEHCRRNAVPIEQNPIAEHISVGQDRRDCCGVNACDSSVLVEKAAVIPQSQVPPGSDEQRICCKSGTCAPNKKASEETVSFDASCSISKQPEKQAASSKLRDCCLEKRCGEKQNSTRDVVNSCQAIRFSDLRVDSNSIHSSVDSTSILSGSMSAKPVSKGCCSQGRCGKAKGIAPTVEASMYSEASSPNSGGGSVPRHAEPIQTTIDIKPNPQKEIKGCCSQGRCSKVKDKTLTVDASEHLEASNLNAGGKSVPGPTELTQNAKDIGLDPAQKKITGCCSQGRCSKAKDNAPTIDASGHLSASSFNASRESVPELTEPIERGRNIESGPDDK